MSAFPSRYLPMTLTAPTPEGRRPTCVAPRVCLGENLLPILSPANTVDLRSWKMDVSPHLAAIFFARPHIPLSQFLLPINTNPDALRIRGVVASCMAGRRQSPALQPGSVLNDSVMLSVGLRVSPGRTAESELFRVVLGHVQAKHRKHTWNPSASSRTKTSGESFPVKHTEYAESE